MRFRVSLILLFAMPCAALYGCIWGERGMRPLEDARLGLAIMVVFVLVYVLPRDDASIGNEPASERTTPLDE